MPVKGTYLAIAGGGIVLLWSGLRGKNWSTVLRDVLAGKKPTAATTAYTISGTPQSAISTDAYVGGSGGTSAAGVTSGSAMQNYRTIGTYLMQNGYSKAAAAGVCGCIAGESGGDPEAVGSGGNGLIGWTPARPGFVTGNASRDMQTQLPALIEYNNQQGASLVAQLKAMTNPLSAMYLYSRAFERPAVQYSDTRPATCLAVYALL